MVWSRTAWFLLPAFLFFLCGTFHRAGSQPASQADSSLEARRQHLKQLIDEEWEYELKESPETATTIGDYRYNDKWSDYSIEHTQQQKRDAQTWLTRFEAVDTTGFPEQEKLNQSLMVRNLKERIEGIDLKLYEMPINQFSGVQINLGQFVSDIPFQTTKQYEDYLARLHGIPHLLDQVVQVARQGQKDGLMPPRYLLEKTVTQCEAIAEPTGEANVFGHSITQFPDTVLAADRKRLHDAIIAAVDTEVRPAFQKLGNFIRTEYAPHGRTEFGLWALSNGDALYRYSIRVETTTSMDPEAIHQLGLQEVARIEKEELVIAKKMGFSDLPSFRASLKTNPALTPKSREEILDRYRHYIGQMEPELPKIFGLLPKTKLLVEPTESFREKNSAAADYNQGTPDGSRPGIIHVNTGDYANRSFLSMESTAYHEGVPGHHLQLSIAQTLPDLPTFRQQAGYTAYIEGWALYAERLGKDVGFYQDPYSDFGRLGDEMLRAIRLVADTGVHYKHWTRQQMVDFLHAHSSESEPDVQAETDRYIAYPAQALAYKLGQLEILKLRTEAQQQLGDKYDIRKFHDEILNGGALPLDVLDARVTAWIAAQKAGKESRGN